MGQLNTSGSLFCPKCEPTFPRVNQFAIGFLHQLSCARIPWTSIASQSVKLATTSESCSLFHFPTFFYPPPIPVISQTADQLTFQGFARLDACWIWWRGRTDTRASNSPTEVEGIVGFWGLRRKQFYTATAAVYRALLMCSQGSFGSWAFCWDDNHIKISDWNSSWRLPSRISCAWELVFVKRWPLTRRKQRRAWTIVWYEYTGVD